MNSSDVFYYFMQLKVVLIIDINLWYLFKCFIKYLYQCLNVLIYYNPKYLNLCFFIN